MAGRPAGDIIAPGTRFGRLTVLIDNGIAMDVRCDCGKRKTVKRGNVIHGHTKSCGCLRREKTKQTGEANLGKPRRMREPDISNDTPQF